MGRKKLLSNGISVSLYLDAEEWDFIVRLASSKGLSPSQFVRLLISHSLSNQSLSNSNLDNVQSPQPQDLSSFIFDLKQKNLSWDAIRQEIKKRFGVNLDVKSIKSIYKWSNP